MKQLLLSILSLSFYFSAGAQCSLIEVPLNQRVSNSTLVVEGKVISTNSFWNSNNTMIYTSNEVEIYKIFKGSISTSVISVITEGGTVGLNRITTEPAIGLEVGDIGVFTCSPPTHMRNLPINISGIPQYEAYASSQGFLKYDLVAETASDPFHTYLDVQNDVYPAVLDPALRNYTVVQSFNIHASATQHQGPNPTPQAPTISSFSPATITGGTNSVLTINGSGFGASQGTGTIGFKNGDDGGATYINPLATQVLTWTNTQITVEVPSNAGTGTIQVSQSGTATSASSLTISYSTLNVDFDPGSGTRAYQTDHINDDGVGGYTWRMNTAFDAATSERASFMRAFDTWRCATGVRWIIGANTSVNDAISDGINCICNDNTAPLSAGILGVCYSYWSGCSSGPTIIWYVAELDIIFDDGSNISPQTWQYGPALPTISQYDFETVAVHELGHGHQLAHVINNGAIMHYAISNGASNRSLSANDLAGGNFIQAKSVVANVCGPGAMTAYSCAAPPVANFSGTPLTLCAGGTVAFTDLSTNTPTSWAWSFTGGTPSTSTSQNPVITYNTAGTYAVTLTATNGSGSDGQTNNAYITVYQNPTASALSQTNISCNGGSNGAASVSVSGGTPAYTYNWTPGNPTGDGTASVTGLSASTWTCTVSDSHTCTSSQTFNITQPSVIVLTAASQTNISCNGGSNGAASVNAATGGAGGYTYNWTPGNPIGDGTVSVTGLTVGTWTCTVTDANSCTTTRTFNITQPGALVASALSQTNISCNSGSNGAASVSVSGGTASYSYNWTPGNPTGDGTASVSGLTVGTWTCTVTDANSCVTTQTFNITQPSALVASALSQTNISCNAGSNGAASVSVIGGTATYSYNWTPGNPTGDGTASVSGLTNGSWTCTVTDANSCVTTQTFNITQPSAITASIASTPTGCLTNTGTATVSGVLGGTGGYTYNWTPSGGTASSATSLGVGTYTCTITDANSCTITKTVNVTSSLGPTLTAASQTNLSCNGGSNGVATVNAATGGTSPYTYDWTPGNPTGDGTVSVTGLTAGSWTCTVTDALGCTAFATFTITQPVALSVVRTRTNVTCFGANNGSATATVSGGTLPYAYVWSPVGGNAATASPLTAGAYTCTVTDANGCTISPTFLITQPNPLFAAPSQTDVLCNGGSTGTASFNASGGVPAYTFAWLPSGGSLNTASGLTAGNYTCTVTDANGCTLAQTFTITQPTPISIVMGETDENCTNADGTATASPSGGVAGYTYLWAPTGQTLQTAVNLSGGSYTCTVTDANGCTASNTILVNSIGCSLPPVASFVGSPTTVCSGGSVAFTDQSTNTPTSWAWTFTGGTPSTSNAQNPSIVYNTPGSYAVSLTATNGNGNNTVTLNGYITVNPLPTISVVSNPVNGIVCSGSPATLTASGANTYSWTGGITNGIAFTPAATTTYTVTGTSLNGCQNTAQSTITVNNCSLITTTVPCGLVFTKKTQSVSAANVASAISYRFSFYNNITNVLLTQYSQASRTLQLSSVPNLYYNTTYKWSVAVDVGSGFGPESNINCTITLGIPSTTVPCGVSYNNLGGYSTVIAPGGTGNYKFSFYNSVTNALITTRTQMSTYIYFNQVPALAYGNTYKWTVACEYALASGGSTYGPESNMNCNITFNAPQTTVPCGHNYTISTGYTVAPTVSGALGYRFTFYHNSIQTAQRSQTSNYIYFNQVVGIVNNTIDTWTVEVLYFNGVSNVYGPASAACIITFGPSPVRMMNPDLINQDAINSDKSDDPTLSVYPNPTNDLITVQTEESISTIYVYSVSGQLMKTVDNTNQVSLGDLSPGTYFIMVNTSKGMKRSVVIKE